MYTSCTPRKDTQENWVNSLNGPSHHLIYHFQKKAKDLGWGWDEGWGRYERLLGKAQWTRVRFLCKFKSSIRVSRDLKSSFSFHSRERERHPKKKKKNGDFSYKYKCLLRKNNFYLVFRGSQMSASS